MNENIINSMVEADMKELSVPLIAVYEHPDGYPEKCVARIYDMGEPTDTVMVMDSVDEIREDIELNTDMTFFPPGSDDVASLAGVWL